MFFTKDSDKFTFVVGNKQYCLTSPLSREKMEDILVRVDSQIKALPPHLTQDEKLLVTLLSMTADLDSLEDKLESLVAKN